MCVEQKEAEVRKLQLLLREKERDLQKLRRVLSNNEETIMVLLTHAHTHTLVYTDLTIYSSVSMCYMFVLF